MRRRKRGNMETYKERTIKAFERIIRKYRDPLGRRFFAYPDCPLCSIHAYGDIDGYEPVSCRGCPLADIDGRVGCTSFISYIYAYTAIKESLSGMRYVSNVSASIKEAFDARAKFFEKYLSVIKNIPAERFTREGWKYFDELDRDD